MSTSNVKESRARFPNAAFLLAGILIGTTIAGAVGAIASTNSKRITVCADKTTNMLRYSKKGKCTKNERKLVLNSTGVVGPTGATGPAGAQGVAGPAGAAGGLSITELWICDGPDVDSVFDERCKVGMTGPAGGVVFFVDYVDQYSGFNYLEVASVDVSEPGVGTEITWCSSIASLGLNTWSAKAIGAGERNTTRMLDSSKPAYCTSGAAKVAADYVTVANGSTFDDWFLPSSGELQLMYSNLGEVGVGNFTSGYLWSSTENGKSETGEYAVHLYFDTGFSDWGHKTRGNLVRPVRAF